MTYSFQSPLTGIASLCLSPSQRDEFRDVLAAKGKNTVPGFYLALDLQDRKIRTYTRRLWSEMPKENPIVLASWAVPTDIDVEGYSFDRYQDFVFTGRCETANLFPLCRPDGPVHIPLGGKKSLLGLYGIDRAVEIMTLIEEKVEPEFRPVILDDVKEAPYKPQEVTALCRKLLAPKPV